NTFLSPTHITRDAEALCGRGGILTPGELRGVGGIAELKKSIHRKVEIVWQGKITPAAFKAIAAECHTAGDTTRAVIAEESQDVALEALRRERLRLISVTPVRMSLEDYFISQVGMGEVERGTGDPPVARELSNAGSA